MLKMRGILDVSDGVAEAQDPGVSPEYAQPGLSLGDVLLVALFYVGTVILFLILCVCYGPRQAKVIVWGQ